MNNDDKQDVFRKAADDIENGPWMSDYDFHIPEGSRWLIQEIWGDTFKTEQRDDDGGNGVKRVNSQ